MDVLVALGTSAAYFYSVLGIVLHLLDDNFTSHLYFETSALLITFIMLGRYTHTFTHFHTPHTTHTTYTHTHTHHTWCVAGAVGPMAAAAAAANDQVTNSNE
jgi:cation transport ATPase